MNWDVFEARIEELFHIVPLGVGQTLDRVVMPLGGAGEVLREVAAALPGGGPGPVLPWRRPYRGRSFVATGGLLSCGS